jgi:hypothetical protein
MDPVIIPGGGTYDVEQLSLPADANKLFAVSRSGVKVGTVTVELGATVIACLPDGVEVARFSPPLRSMAGVEAAVETAVMMLHVHLKAAGQVPPPRDLILASFASFAAAIELPRLPDGPGPLGLTDVVDAATVSAGLQRKELCGQAGVAPSTLSSWLNHRKPVTRRFADAVLDALELDRVAAYALMAAEDGALC